MKRDYANVSFWASERLVNRMKRFNETNHTDRTKLIEVALKEYIKKKETNSDEKSDS